MRISLFVSSALLLGTALLMPPVASAQKYDRGAYAGRPGSGRTVTCSSQDFHYRECPVPFDRDVVIVQQLSDTACRRGQNWGYRRGSLWVDKGCSARFAQARTNSRHGNRYGRGNAAGRAPTGWNRDIRLTCQSQDQRYRMCRVDLGRQGTARIQRQLSDQRCVRGRNWGYNRAGVWVSGGCRAQFVVSRRW